MWEQIRANKRNSVFLITGLALLLVGLGYGIGMAVAGPYAHLGIIVAVVLWLILFLAAVYGGRDILLMSAHAREIQHDDHPQLFNVVEEMTIAAGLPKRPKVYIIDSDSPNAFAVGTPENSAVAITSGLLMKLKRDEVQGVIAHEIGHIHNQDTRFMTVAGVMVAAIVIIADIFVRGMFYSGAGRRRSSGRGGGQAQAVLMLVAIVFAILAPILAQLLYLACSRRREYLADACAARFTRYPEGLASALEKIAGGAAKMSDVSRATAPMYIVNPLKGSSAHSLFSTHPPTSERVRILRSMAGGTGYGAYEAAFSKVSGDHLIGKQSLSGADAPGVRAPSPKSEQDDLAAAREVVDILHRMDGLIFLPCVCGLKIKVPEGYKNNKVKCPSCNRTLDIPAPVLLAASAAAAMDMTAETEKPARRAPARAPADRPLVINLKGGGWQSFRCSCGHAIQLSPNFSGNRIRCGKCRRNLSIKRS